MLGVVFHKLAIGMIVGMAVGITLDARSAKQNARDKANIGYENKGNFDEENTGLNDQK
ncbi:MULTISPECIES: hypothetical protein [unclassified Mucilaginibacter]|uniref:hypothetical protein n=1 Tax=unclassified Mucilaginibacter TaxID=2617802 RepID=UPI002AC9C885|nr:MULTISPECIES: hypothetical protein [unclassified Mucilaginibacter]MEB0249717.1 hypothetical protein [Mucilaginibacter sp. 5B2]MEB0260495.1 hypothetical protein [Mucilaginibacter sp. 10I4]MEB0280077.1 hypothetical protein [Mucilaginibacter sp. 10B2]WPX23582.1 hypothetical protein RHM67_20115 [Mucilaginibacter sp. 5C4]